MEQHSKSSTWTLSGPDCQHWWGYLATASRCDLHLSPSEPRKVHVPHHCARLQILKSATSRRATGEHRLEAWSSFKSWGFNRASTRLKRCWMIWMLPSHPACLLEEHWPRCRRLLQKLPALCSDFFPPTKTQETSGTPWDPLGNITPRCRYAESCRVTHRGWDPLGSPWAAESKDQGTAGCPWHPAVPKKQWKTIGKRWPTTAA